MRLVLTAALLAAVPAAAQMPTTKPGAADPARVKAGTYAVDPEHTLVLFTVDHLGFSTYWGIFGGATGTMTLDPKAPNAAKVDITIPLDRITTTNADLNKHLLSADFFDAAKFPTATFKSTAVKVSGTTARIAGNLTLHGVTKPIVLDAKFTGAGVGPFPPQPGVVGFEATTTVKRSDFGVSAAAALISDVVPLKISVAFERK